MLHDSSVAGDNKVISCQLLSEIEFTGGFEACCKLLQGSKVSYFQYRVTIQWICTTTHFFFLFVFITCFTFEFCQELTIHPFRPLLDLLTLSWKDPWKATRPLFPLGLSYGILPSNPLKRPEVQGCDSVYWICFLFSGSWTPQCHVEPLQTKLPSKLPASVHSLFAHLRKWPPMPSRNLLDCLCSALLSVYQMTGGSGHSWWTIANVKPLQLSEEASSILDQTVCRRHPPNAGHPGLFSHPSP